MTTEEQDEKAAAVLEEREAQEEEREKIALDPEFPFVVQTMGFEFFGDAP